MAVGKEIKTKIASVQSTRKITSAMEMVAASKMRKAQDRMESSRPYARSIRGVIQHLAKSNPEYKHLYMQDRETKRVGFIVVATDRGLCGGLNVNAFKAAVKSMKEFHDQNIEIDICSLGSKSATFFKNYGGNVVAAKSQLGDAPEVADLIGSVKVMLDAYDEGKRPKWLDFCVVQSIFGGPTLPCNWIVVSGKRAHLRNEPVGNIVGSEFKFKFS